MRERERENHSGIREWVLSTELIKTSPFNGLLSLSLSLSLVSFLSPSLVASHTHTHQVYIHARMIRRRIRRIGIVLVTVSR